MSNRLTHILGKGAEWVAASMLAAIFATFVFQIVARYILGLSIGWTIEVNLTLWLWLVLWSCAFVIREREHVKFDLVYQQVSPRTRKIFAILASAIIVVALVSAMPASWDYVSFYKIKRSDTLRIPLIYVFSIYLVFATAVIVRYAWRIIDILRGRDLTHDEADILPD